MAIGGKSPKAGRVDARGPRVVAADPRGAAGSGRPPEHAVDGLVSGRARQVPGRDQLGDDDRGRGPGKGAGRGAEPGDGGTAPRRQEK